MLDMVCPTYVCVWYWFLYVCVWVFEEVFCVWSEIIFCVIVFVTCINVVLIYYFSVSMFYMDLVFEVYIILMSC